MHLYLFAPFACRTFSPDSSYACRCFKRRWLCLFFYSTLSRQRSPFFKCYRRKYIHRRTPNIVHLCFTGLYVPILVSQYFVYNISLVVACELGVDDFLSSPTLFLQTVTQWVGGQEGSEDRIEVRVCFVGGGRGAGRGGEGCDRSHGAVDLARWFPSRSIHVASLLSKDLTSDATPITPLPMFVDSAVHAASPSPAPGRAHTH